MLAFGLASPLSAGEPGKSAEDVQFSSSSSEVVLRVTWKDSRTLRSWTRLFFGDGRVETADVGPDGQPVDDVRSSKLEPSALDALKELAVSSGLCRLTQEELTAKIEATGRSRDITADAELLTVELHFREVGADAAESREAVRVFVLRDVVGLSAAFPEVVELQVLARLLEVARRAVR